MNLLYKSSFGQLKDVDLKSRTVVAYASVFGNKDSHGDVMQPSAYAKTLQERGERLMHLFNHDANIPVGKVQRAFTDEKGLRFESKLSESTWGKDVLKMYEEGILSGHSVGFFLMKDEYDSEAMTNFIKEVALYEVSTVTFPANEEAVVVGLKSIDAYLDNFEKALKRGTFTDETFARLEKLYTLAKSQHTQPQSSTEPSKEKQDLNLLKIFNDQLK